MKTWWSGLATACAAVLLASGAMADDAVGDVPLPDGVRPFGTPIELAYAGIGRFTFVFRSDIELPTGQRVIAEGWVMDGSARRDGAAVAWSYRLSNIGRDGIERERGSLHVRTDAWGAVQQARVLQDRWAPPPGRPRSGADALFTEQGLVFPLCCCPRGPIRMGDALDMPAETVTMPASALPPGPMPPEIESLRMTYRGRSTAAGVLDMDGRLHLVVRHEADVQATVPDTAGLTMRRSGYTLLDTRTCMPRRSVWRSRYEVATGKPTPGVMTMWQSQTLR